MSLTFLHIRALPDSQEALWKHLQQGFEFLHKSLGRIPHTIALLTPGERLKEVKAARVPEALQDVANLLAHVGPDAEGASECWDAIGEGWRLAKALLRPGEGTSAEWVENFLRAHGEHYGNLGTWPLRWRETQAAVDEFGEAILEALRPATSAIEGMRDEDDGERSPAKSRGRKGKRINEKMAAMVQQDAELWKWTAKQWSDALGCAESTIVDTHTWKGPLASIKAREEAERQLQEERKNRDAGGKKRRSEG